MNVSEKNKKLIFFLFSALYVVASQLINNSFFVPLIEHIGSENKAYQYPQTGLTLENDMLSKVFCRFFACVVACVFLYALCRWLLFLYQTWKSQNQIRKYIIILAVANLLAILFLICLYPQPISLSPDTYYNYVYARAWLPMYWHGFLTNVIYCASMIIFPHPFSMTLIPCLFAINLFGYFIYCTLIKRNKHGLLWALLFTVFLFFMPETIQIATFVGRNYMYAIVCFSFLCIILLDHCEQRTLTASKCIVLSVLLGVLMTWRTEGILWLPIFPFLVYFTYFHKKNVTNVLKKYLIMTLFILVSYSILNVPVKYGNEKYQDSDYFIINLPGPLSAVLNNPDANLTYNGAEDDLATIDSVVPIEYIKKYGEFGSITYNYDNGRVARQCDAGAQGTEFVVASYNLLLHNLDIYLKFQINLFCESLFLPIPFDVPYEEGSWHITETSAETYNFVMNYYSIGERDINQFHGITFINTKIDQFAEFLFLTLLSYEYILTGWIKLLTTFAVLLICIHALIRKRWVYFFTGGALLGILFAIILTAPTARSNYYFYPFFCQYWLIMFYIIEIKHKPH